MTTNTDGAMPELPVVAYIPPEREGEYHGSDNINAYRSQKAGWEPLVRLSDARAAIQQAAGVGPEGLHKSWDGIKERCPHGVRWENPCTGCQPPVVGGELGVAKKQALDDVLLDLSATTRASVELSIERLRKLDGAEPVPAQWWGSVSMALYTASLLGARTAASPAPPKQQPVRLGGGEAGRVPDGWQLVPIEPDGNMWSASRREFIKFAQQYEDAPTAERASIIGDIAGPDIYRAMLQAAYTGKAPRPESPTGQN